MIATRSLTTPFGFTRQFFGLRDSGDNKKLFKEGYAQIPQGTVGQNTGFAILWLETYHHGYVTLDDHDAVTLEVASTAHSVWEACTWLRTAFDRIIRFPRGLELTIPIEIEIGFDLANMKVLKCADLSEAGVTNIYNGLAKHQKAPDPGISGHPPQLSQERAAETCG
jgi:hypothetical protein